MNVWKLIAVLFFMTIGLSGCSDTYEWNEKITIEVETPDGLKTASSIQAFTLVDTWWGLPEMKGISTYLRKGEAVVLEVTSGEYLFALLRSEKQADRRSSLYYIPGLKKSYKHAFGVKEIPSRFSKGITGRMALIKELKHYPVTIPKKYYPLLVTFRKVNDPTSVVEVWPDGFEVFGKDIKLKRITLQSTEEPVTFGQVEKVLSWIGSIRG